VIKSKELVTDDYRLFPDVKRNCCVQQFKDDDELKTLVTGWLLIQDMDSVNRV
jgi:hypothetical protein